MNHDRQKLLEADRDSLNRMILSLRARLPGSAGPYNGYLADLEERIATADSIEQPDQARNLVTLNSSVQLRDPASGQRHTFSVVQDEQADWRTNAISVLTPLGSELLGAEVGDEINWNTLRGRRRLVIERVGQRGDTN